MYIVNYSSSGFPLWVNHIKTPGVIAVFSVKVDSEQNFYLVGQQTQSLEVFATDKTLKMTLDPLVGELKNGFILSFYNNGYYRCSSEMLGYYVMSVNVSYQNPSTLFISGYGDSYPSGTEIYFIRPPLSPLLVETIPCHFTEANRLFIARLNITLGSMAETNPANYNEVFQTQIRIGGSNQYYQSVYSAEGDIEIWGGKTEFIPSSLTIADVNTGSICYYGRCRTSGLAYQHLTVNLKEPSFPENDPQPLTPGSVNYGYLSIFVQFSWIEMTSVYFNTNQDQSENLKLICQYTSAIDAPFESLFQGIEPGDEIRILIQGSSYSGYFNLHVKEILWSQDLALSEGEFTIVFEEPVRYIVYALNKSEISYPPPVIRTVQSATPVCYIPLYWKPTLIQSGTLRVILTMGN